MRNSCWVTAQVACIMFCLLANGQEQITVLHLLGLDHTRLTWRNVGRDFRLTDVYGSVVKEILA